MFSLREHTAFFIRFFQKGVVFVYVVLFARGQRYAFFRGCAKQIVAAGEEKGIYWAQHESRGLPAGKKMEEASLWSSAQGRLMRPFRMDAHGIRKCGGMPEKGWSGRLYLREGFFSEDENRQKSCLEAAFLIRSGSLPDSVWRR